MALEFHVISMRKDSHSREYTTKIKLGDSDKFYSYGICFNGSNVYFNPWLSGEYQLSILDMNDCPFNSHIPDVRVSSLDHESAERQEEFRGSLVHFLRTKCSEGNDLNMGGNC